tara:strand:+ start:1 stop:3261 length:3261 start_codon:yes stop_codon:yes gene_type:complete
MEWLLLIHCRLLLFLPTLHASPPLLAVRIVSPRHASTIPIAGPQASDVAIVVAYENVNSELSASHLALELSIDGRTGETAARMGPPLPAMRTFFVGLRWGSHTARAQLINATSGRAIPGSSSRVVFVDLVPTLDAKLLLSDGELADTRLAERPSAAPWAAHATCLRRAARVVLIGNLRTGGQTRLAVEQARRLPQMLLADGTPAFELLFATSSEPHASTAQLLESWGVPVARYRITLDRRWYTEQRGAQAAVDALRRFASWDELLRDEPTLAAALGELVRTLRGADIVSFTNHESVAANDRLLVHAARLAGVGTVLCEPANLWWGSEPTWRDGVDGFVVPSAFAGQFWLNHGVSLPMLIINPGVPAVEDCRRPNDSNDAAAAAASTTTINVVFIGRLVPQKSPGLFVRMAAAVDAAFRDDERRSVHFDVVGDGSLLDALKDLSLHLHLGHGAITFHGALSHSDVMQLLVKRADVVVHTNLLEETFCMVNVEAMSAGVPVVTFGVGGVSEYLRSGDAHSTVVGSPSTAALAAAVIGAIENREERVARGERARHHVSSLHGWGVSNDRMARQYAQMYSRMVCGKRVPLQHHMVSDGVSVPKLLQRASDLLACGATQCHRGARGKADAFSHFRSGDKRRGACLFLACGIASIEEKQSVGLALVHNAGAALLGATEASGANRLPSNASVFEQIDIAGSLCALVAERTSLADASFVAGASAVFLGLHDTAARHYTNAARARRSPNADAKAAAILGSGVGEAVEWLGNAPRIGQYRQSDTMHTFTTPTRLHHDALQYRHLLELGVVNASIGTATAAAFDALALRMSAAPDCDVTQQKIPESDAAVLEVYGRAVYIATAPALASGALQSPSGERWSKAGRDFASSMVAVVDGVFSAEALQSLRDFCAQSTVFFDIKNGHLGAYLEDGFAPAIALQAADQLREVLPLAVGRLRLTQVWAYKYLSEMGIRPHADEGAVTVNCWLTPDDANLNVTTGGLRLWNDLGLPPRKSWDRFALIRDFRSIRTWLASRAAELNVSLTNASTEIMYRQNRCVIFRSALFHETIGPVRFKRGLGKRRINLSFMFGMADSLQEEA